MTSSRLLVPVTESATLRSTVEYAVRQALEHGIDPGSSATVHFVYPVSERPTFETETNETQAAKTLLERVAVWAQEDCGDDVDAVTFKTAMIGTQEYLFSPGDYADIFAGYARNHELNRVVFDPGFNPLGTTPLLPPLENEVRRAGLEIEKAPVQRERRAALLERRGTIAQYLALFGISFGFYLLLAGTIDTFEIVTGVITAGIVATALWGISLTAPIQPIRAGKQLGRFALYVPYLLYEIVKANFEIAYVVLHPDLPIDPEVIEFDAAVWSALPVTVLANSITLTPGTLTVDVSRQHFTVHTLTKSTREGLLSGSLERAVRFVFYGRAAARIPSPLERRGTEEGE